MSEQATPGPRPTPGVGLLGGIAIVLMTILFVTLMTQVGLRFLSLALPWTDSLAVPVFIWLVFVGAAIACRRNEHPFIEIGYMQAERHLGPRRLAQLNAVIACVSLLFLLVLAYGLGLMMRQTWFQTTGLLRGFHLGYVYLGALLGVAACIGALVARLWMLWRGEPVAAHPPTDLD